MSKGMNREDIKKMYTFHELKQMLQMARGVIVDIIQNTDALSQREKDVLYMRNADWLTLEEVGEEMSVTRERIRQIEAKAEEKIRATEKDVV